MMDRYLTPSTTIPTEAAIAAAEQRLGHAYPPSFRALLQKHGLFGLHAPGDPTSIRYRTWPLDEHQTALERAADELECEATAEEVAEQLGLDAEMVAALAQIVLVGSEGNTDFVGFDLRTRDGKTQEAAFVLQLMDDTEIEYLAAHPGSETALGFDALLEGFERRHR